MMQALLRNPLADPYVLGISAGASVGALVALLSMGASPSAPIIACWSRWPRWPAAAS
jgi:ABC-type Fe3+-siderophore transport system permease subunit